MHLSIVNVSFGKPYPESIMNLALTIIENKPFKIIPSKMHLETNFDIVIK